MARSRNTPRGTRRVSLDAPGSKEVTFSRATSSAEESNVKNSGSDRADGARNVVSKTSVYIEDELLHHGLSKATKVTDLRNQEFIGRQPFAIINREALGQELSFDDRADSSSNTLCAVSEPVILPEYLNDYLRQALSVRPNDIYEDLLSRKLLLDIPFRSRFRELWDDAKKYLTDGDTHPRGLAAANAKELSTAQQLVGAPCLHPPLGVERHHVHDKIPAGFSSRDWSWVAKFAQLLRDTTKPADSIAISLPRLTSQGLVLKSKRDTADYRLFSKVLLGLAGSRCRSAEEFDSQSKAINDFLVSYGYSPYADYYAQGRRRQSTRKPEPVLNGNVSHVRDLRLLGYTSHEQGRNRAIFMAGEREKAYDKETADIFKKCIFFKTRTFSVIPEELRKHLKLITDNAVRVGQDGIDPNGEQYCFCDMSSFDTTTHAGFLHIWIEFLKNFFPDKANHFSEQHSLDRRLVAPISWGDSNIISIKNFGASTMSGEAYVTVKNNFVHLAAYLQALHEVYHIDQLDVWKALEDPNNHDFELHLHGDDCMRYFGDNTEVYDKIDEIMIELGLKPGRELAPAFLKKQMCSDEGQMRGITGSLMKNRFSEYGVSEPCVLSMGLWDTWQMIPDRDRDCIRPLWKHIATLGIPNFDPTSASFEELKRVVLPKLTEYASSKSSKAREIQSLLERLYYSNGEELPYDLDELWGSLQFNLDDEGERLGLSKLTQNQLLKLILEVQRYLFDHDGEHPKKEDIQSLTNKIIEYDESENKS